MSRKFSVNISGRVKNFNLPKNQALIPLFEAVVNSIHAIEERHHLGENFKGEINVKILRDHQISFKDQNILSEIKSFEITDNGIGFNDSNFESFLESDSTYKSNLGGKGVGRLSWLVAFEKAVIESIYHDKSKCFKREFEFSENNSEIDDKLYVCEKHTDNITTVKLINCLESYRRHLPKSYEKIAIRLIEHCLIYFINPNCPQINLIDDDGKKHNLNNMFKEKIKAEENKVILEISGKEFELLHVKAEENSIGGNKLYLCAHNRLVESRDLDKYIADLDKEIYNKCGFWYVGVLKSKYFDDTVDMNRLSFRISNSSEQEMFSESLCMDTIIKAVIDKIKFFLGEYLGEISKRKMERIERYTQLHPLYRNLKKYMPDEINNIKPNLSDEKLDDELHKIRRKLDKKNKEIINKIFEDLNGHGFGEQYRELYAKQLERLSSCNTSTLAEYVICRQTILKMLKKAICKKDDDKFEKEKFIHNLIYPMSSTSDDSDYFSHNLWIIDEKLAYCSYISSDIPFNNDPKQKRTDIMILDRPVAVSDRNNDGTEYDNITIFELKRPMRDDYNNDNNPITQLYNYVSIMKEQKVRDKCGRPIKVGSNTKFYLYAICDITSKLEKIIKERDFSQTPDKIGYYDYNKGYNAYIEILPYDKIINDAEKRNKIFFDKLGI